MCYQTSFSPKDKLDDIVWKEKLLDAYAVIESITMQGGEPTVLPNCLELVRIITRDFPHVTLDTVTNGLMWNGEWEDAFLSQGSCVNFSLNAIDPSLYSRIMQFSRQAEVIANIDRMVRRKRQIGSKVVLRASTVVLRDTIDEMPRFIEWSGQHGLDQVIFSVDPVLSMSDHDVPRVQSAVAAAYAMADRWPDLEVLCLTDFDRSYAVRHRVAPVRSWQEMARPTGACPVGFDAMIVGYRGIVRPCCKSWYPFGDLMKSSLREVWSSRAAALFRGRMLRNDFRDCATSCDLNANPVNEQRSLARRGYWLLRREPDLALAKVKRKFGLSNAQVDLPVLNRSS